MREFLQHIFIGQWCTNEFESGGEGTRSGILFFLAPPLFVSTSRPTISRFGERFRDGQYSLVSFLFAVLLLPVSPCPAICKSGGTCPPPRALCSRRHGQRTSLMCE